MARGAAAVGHLPSRPMEPDRADAAVTTSRPPPQGGAPRFAALAGPVLLAMACLLRPAAAKAEPATGATATLCGALEAAAARNGLPAAFFTRLIWQESRFDPTARSPAGAEGVAQFMPATAAGRGLGNPFEPARALNESAAYLRELRGQFGNVGLAAAAYNAGPGRVARWIAGTASLPQETIGYVTIVTGYPVSAWREAHPPSLAAEPGFSCLVFAGDAGRRRAPAGEPFDPSAPPPKPWAAILVGSFNRAAITAEWQIIRAKHAETLAPLIPAVRRRRLGGSLRKYVVQIESNDRAGSTRLCRQLEREGGSCVVLRNLLR